MSTIAEQIEQLKNHIDANEIEQADQLAEELESRRLKADQKELLASLLDLLATFHVEQDEDEEEEETGTMASQLRKYRERYQSCIAASGSKSLNNGDLLAQFLEYKDHDAVMALADEHTPIEGQTHAQRYAKLNNGQKRMNAGNKLRAAIKKGDLEVRVDDEGKPIGLEAAASH